MRELILKINKEHENSTVGNLLKHHFALSSRLITKLKRLDCIKLNDNHVTVRGVVKQGDILKIILPEEQSENILPVNLPLDIIYEDSDILVVNKPSNMPVHPSLNNYDNSLGNAVCYYYKNTPFVYRPVNRLDKDTTGLVVIAKTQQAASILSTQIQQNVFKKTYLAVSLGVPNPPEGVIDAPIKRVSDSIITRCVSPDGQKAVTNYKVIAQNNNKALSEVDLITGRTHQIRVHFAYIGCPLYADYLYGDEIEGKSFILHCYKLSFVHPISGNQLNFTCKIPQQITDIFS